MTGGFWVVFETQNYCFGSVLGSRIIVLGLLVRFCRFFGLFRLKSTYIRYFLDDFSGTYSILGRFFGRFANHKLLFWVMLQGPPPITPDIFPIESPPRGCAMVPNRMPLEGVNCDTRYCQLEWRYSLLEKSIFRYWSIKS